MPCIVGDEDIGADAMPDVIVVDPPGMAAEIDPATGDVVAVGPIPAGVVIVGEGDGETGGPAAEPLAAGEGEPPADPPAVAAPAPSWEPDRDHPSHPANLARYDAETVQFVVEAERRCSEAEYEYEDAKDQAAELKKNFEKKREELCALIRQRRESRGKPVQKTLLDGVRDTPHEPAADCDGPEPADLSLVGVSDDREAEAPAADPIPVDLHERFPIGGDYLPKWLEWGLTRKDVEKLNEGAVKKDDRCQPLTNLGDVVRFITPNPSNPSFARSLADVKGFGPKGFERWETAHAAFWGWWGKGGREEFAKSLGIITDGEAQPAGVGA
jgi:hypothetical protein